MKRELLLLRHGKSDWSTDSNDFDRPLKDRGKRGAQRMGVWLQQQGLIPDLVVSSPAERALVTAEKCLKAMGRGTRNIRSDARIYEAGLSPLLDVLGECPDDTRRVMLVGHNPGLEDLLIHLADAELEFPEDGKLLPTSTLARLRMPAEWKHLKYGSGRLLSITRPAQLPKKFPFPDANGKEQRDRPAYYYNQSSVIPYRVRKGRAEILIVSSSKRKHWVVPKGIHEPGLDERESAAKEALEEAGVMGKISKAAIGSYQYAKWGAVCTVRVFPMEVSKLLPEAEWEERHRGRKWVSPEQAAEQLRQPELGPMVLTLAKAFRNR